MDGGEGHFIAKFKKQSGVAGKLPVLKSKKLDKITEKFFEGTIEYITKLLLYR